MMAPWIVDTKPASAFRLMTTNPTSGLRTPARGGKPIAAHGQHLHFALDLTCNASKAKTTGRLGV